ncbi:MAG: hypothetical protein M1816_004919 [Peltula sp. TS41687]|nr:MAG: hypothetical protein M1816_004919 [Peltula sp. TS41687]
MQASGDDPYQQKGKRRNSTGAANPIRKRRGPQVQSSILSLKNIKAEQSDVQQFHPSPSTSRTPPKANRGVRKRKATLFTEDNPDLSQVSREPQRKRLRTSGSVVSDPISYCVRHSVWPEGASTGLGASWPSIESRKRSLESEPAAASPSLDPKLPGDGLSKKQKVQFKEAIPRTSDPVIGSPGEPAEELQGREIQQKERHSPISYWAAHHTWPKNFAEHNQMDSSSSTTKRQRTSDRDGRSRSYSQSRKNGEVPEQYSPAYEVHILTKGLDMDYMKGRDLASGKSKEACAELLRMKVDTIKHTAVPQDKISRMVCDCRNRNEAMVNRDVTPLMIPSLRLLYYCGANHLEHVVDEVNAIWYQQCVLEGPRPQPDLAIGLSSSAFTEEEIEKLKRYTSVDNWTQVTTQMFFPFLMCEVKCGRESLDMADRQNMHSCSVAVRAILRLEQEADKYRPGKKMDSLNGQFLVFSISHDQQDARLYGHYAIVQGEKWSYYRYPVRKFDLTDYNSLLAIYNFVQNILKSHLPEHLQRLQDALAVLPDSNKPPESSGLPSSSGLSFAASEISLNDDDNPQQDSQNRDADGFVVPPRPAGSQDSRAKEKGQDRQLVEQLLNELARAGQLLEEQRRDAKQERVQFMRMLEEQRKEAKEEHDKLVQVLRSNAS